MFHISLPLSFCMRCYPNLKPEKKLFTLIFSFNHFLESSLQCTIRIQFRSWSFFNTKILNFYTMIIAVIHKVCIFHFTFFFIVFCLDTCVGVCVNLFLLSPSLTRLLGTDSALLVITFCCFSCYVLTFLLLGVQTIALIHAVIGSEFKIDLLLLWLLTKSRGSSLACYLAHSWWGEKMASYSFLRIFVQK